MKTYEVVEVVHETLLRERRWNVSAISEQDAIRQVLEGEAAEEYVGKQVRLESSTSPAWQVDGMKIEFESTEAVAIDDGTSEIGGHG